MGLAAGILGGFFVCGVSVSAAFGVEVEPATCDGINSREYLPDAAKFACRVPFEPGPDLIQSLEGYMKRSGVRSATSLMPCLPPELRKNFILVQDTHSAHPGCSDEKSPRLVLFSSDGKQLLAFPGKTFQPGCDHVEVVQLGADHKYQAAKIRFEPEDPLPAQTLRPPPRTLRGQEAGCQGCHSGGGGSGEWIPRWSAYPNWPGAYGSMDDGFGFGRDGKPLPNPKEESDYLAFAQASFANEKGEKGRGLYRYLLRPKTLHPGDQAYSPYSNRSADRALAVRPNLRFQAALTRANSDRVADRLVNAPGSLARKLEALESFSGCPLSEARRASELKAAQDLVPGIRKRAQRAYERYITVGRGEPCEGCSQRPVPCQKVLREFSDKNGRALCPEKADLESSPAKLIYQAGALGLGKAEIDNLFPSEFSSTGDTSPEAYTLDNAGGSVSDRATAAAFLIRMSDLQPELKAYVRTDPNNPVCAEKVLNGRPVLQARCAVPETCALPATDFKPGPGDLSYCEKLRELRIRATPGAPGAASSGKPPAQQAR